MQGRRQLVSVVLAAMVLGGAVAWVSLASAQGATQAPETRIEAVKQSFVTSQAVLKSYEWIETMTLAVSGEEKVKQQYRCYYGADGAMQKVPLAADAKEDKKRGLRGKASEKKKAELEASLKGAAALLHKYAPIDPAKMEAAKAAGNISVSVPSASGRVQLTIKNYVQPGDVVTIDVDVNKNTVSSVAITTAMDDGKSKSPVAAKVTYAAFADGTLYPANESLDVTSQSLKVVIQNSGYRKQAQ